MKTNIVKFFRTLPRMILPRLILLSVVLLLIIETLNHRLFIDGPESFLQFLTTHPLAALVDLLLILLTLIPAVFLRRQLFYAVLVSVIWLAGGIANGFILLKRTTPLTAPDIAMLKTGIDTLPNYLPVWAIVLLAVSILLAFAGLVLLFLRGPRSGLPRNAQLRRGIAILMAVFFLLAASIFAATQCRQLSMEFYNLPTVYRNYGFPYCFLQTLLNRGIDRPVDYSETRMTQIASKIPDAGVGRQEDVNILYVQLESLVDPEKIEGLTLTEDAMPNLRSLIQNYSSGALTVPVVGASTANTEFEILTGMRCRYFGPGEYPYKSKGRHIPIDSIVSGLSDLGYTAHAIHNNSTTFYDRDAVYANLGFDTYTGLEYMPAVEETPNGWAKDEVLTSQVLQALDLTDTARDFVFTVSVQCHGTYPKEPVIEDPRIELTACPENIDWNSMTYYVNQLWETDRFIGDLIAALEDRNEPTVVVFYGDHQPSLNLSAATLESGTIFQTEYVIWDNIGLEAEDVSCASYQLSAMVMHRLDLDGGLLFRFHTSNAESSLYAKDLQAIQYDLLYGEQYLYGEDLPEASELTLGTAEITIAGIEADTDRWYVTGENFTPFCQVAQGDDLLETTYCSGTLLEVYADPEDAMPETWTIEVVDKHRELLSEIDE